VRSGMGSISFLIVNALGNALFRAVYLFVVITTINITTILCLLVLKLALMKWKRVGNWGILLWNKLDQRKCFRIWKIGEWVGASGNESGRRDETERCHESTEEAGSVVSLWVCCRIARLGRLDSQILV